MKHLIGLMLLSAMLWGCASPGMKGETIPEAERTMAIKYEIPGASRDVLFNHTLQWLNSTVLSKGGQIIHKDQIQGSISTKVMTSYSNMFVEVPARYTMRVDFKDGRIRVTCYDFEDFWGEFRKTARPVEDTDFLRQLMQKAKETGDTLHRYLKGETLPSKRDW